MRLNLVRYAPLFIEIVRNKMRDRPLRRMRCPDCKKTVAAASWWTSDETMLDWYCPNCERPIETVILHGDRTLLDYFTELRGEWSDASA